MSDAPSRSTFREYLEALLIAGLFLGFTNYFVVKTFFIPSGSMENTLLVGDHLFVNRFIYGASPTAVERVLLPRREPRRGDIVIFRSPKEPTLDLVKRLVGLPGDTIRILDKQLYVNNQRVDDAEYVVHQDSMVYRGQPMLLLSSETDRIFEPWEYERTIARYSQLERHVIAGGHDFLIQNAEETAQWIADFHLRKERAARDDAAASPAAEPRIPPPHIPLDPARVPAARTRFGSWSSRFWA